MRVKIDGLAKLTMAVAGAAILVLAVVKPLPEAKAKTTDYVFEVETETEIVTVTTMEEYLHSKAEKANEELLERVEELHTTEAETETEEEFVPFTNIDLPGDLQKEIYVLCQTYEIDYTFFIGWMFTESRCHWSIGADNDTGYMQIIPQFHQAGAEELGINIYSEIGNCVYAMVLLNRYLESNDGDLRKALQQYNTGDPNTMNGYAERVFENVEYLKNDE